MKKIGKIITIITTMIAAMAVVFACALVEMNNNKANVIKTNSAYDLSNTIDEENLTFEVISETDKTCKFTGLTASQFNSLTATLSIPEYATIDDVPYKVVEIDTADSDQTTDTVVSNDLYMQSIQYYGMYITAIIVPNTVEKINEAAFYGMASLQYIQTPFTKDIINSSTDTISGVWGFHKLFGKGYRYVDGDGYLPEFKRYYEDSDQKVSNEIVWYDLVATSELYFQVPAELEKVVITKADKFGQRTFKNFETLEEVVLPEGLAGVGEGTFNNCTHLTNVNIPSSLQTLGDGMFVDCKALEEITIPRVLTIPENIFGGCSALERVVMPTSVTSIKSKAFYGCANLRIELYKSTDPTDTYSYTDQAVIFPEGLTEIGEHAFYGVTTITDLIIPKMVTSIGSGAFMGCSSMRSISLPFVGASKGINSSQNEKNAFGYIFGLNQQQAMFYRIVECGATFSIPESLTTIDVYDDTEIASSALGNLCLVSNTTILKGVTTLTIGKNTILNSGALAGSNSIINLTIPHIGSKSDYSDFGIAFAYDSSNPNNVNNAGTTATTQNHGTYYIPNAIRSVVVTNQHTIYSGSFSHCIYLEKVEIGNATQIIQEGIFFDNQNLNSLILPFVGEQRGAYYGNWYTWWRYRNIRNMLSWVFTYSPFTGSYADISVAENNSYKRYVPKTLVNVEITNETCIDYRSFRNLTSIKTLTISDDEGILSYIDEGAAINCTSLTTLNLPYIGYNKNEASLDGTSHIAGWILGRGAGYSAYGCNAPETLTTINVDYVGRIPANAFRGLTSLSTVKFNTKVESIGANAFYGCTNLSDVNYTSDTVFTNVEDYAFYNCGKINTIAQVIPAYSNGNITLGKYSMAKTSISEIDFTKLSSVGDYCFSGCLNLTAANVTANTTIGNGLFADCLYLTDVTLAEGKVGKYMFKGCSSLTRIDLSTAIINKVIPEGMFQNCTKLKWGNGNTSAGLVLGSQITLIESYAFAGCESLTRFVIPAAVTTLGDAVFRGANNLEDITIPVNTRKVGKNLFTENIGHGFIVWVYLQEEEWPWQDGWSCLNPVKVLPGIDDSMYEFEFRDDLAGYVITGFKPEISGLEGTLELPSRHDGVVVLGVSGKLLANEPKIYRVVVPSCYNYFVTGALDNGSRVDVYFEDKMATAPYLFRYDANNKVETISRLNESESLRSLIAMGHVFYDEHWDYVTSNNGISTPYLLSSSIKFSVDVYTTKTIYNSEAWTPEIYEARLPGFTIINEAISGASVSETFDPTIYDYKYYDNVNAGTARVVATLNDTYQTFLQAQGNYWINLLGDGATTFTIEKHALWVMWDEASEYALIQEDTYYPNKYFTISNWTSNNISNYDDSKYSFNGTLSTRRTDAGEYFIFGEEYNDDFYWSRDWSVRFKGLNVTSNFSVQVFLDLTITPLEVDLKWTNATLEDSVYHYQYNGTSQNPTAAAYVSGTDTLVPECIVDVARLEGTDTIIPGQSGSAYAYINTSIRGNYEVNNADLYDVTYGNVIRCNYIIDKAQLRITITDMNYLIPINAVRYEFQDWKGSPTYYVMEGLAPGSVFKGRVVTVPFGTYNAHEKNVLYNKDNGGTDWENQVFDFTGCKDVNVNWNSMEAPYLIARYDDDGNITLFENNYYDVDLNASVKIKYNNFDNDDLEDGSYEYYVGDQKLDVYESISNPGTYEAIYKTDGEPRNLTIRLMYKDIDLTDSCSITYTYDNNGGSTTPYVLKELGVYNVEVDVVRNNFESLEHNLNITVVRSDVEHINLDKEYDGLDVDLDTFITKKGVGQTVTLTKCLSDKTVTDKTIVPNTYYIHVVADETAYFNACDYYYEYTISKRKIHIYVDRVNYLDETSQIKSSTPYTGDKYTIQLDSSLLSDDERINLVGNDNISGVLSTASSAPGRYNTQISGEWYWTNSWKVFDTETYIEHSSFYQVVLHSYFDITKLDMNVIHAGETTDYDSALHSITVAVTKPEHGYKIYYSLEETEFDEIEILDKNDEVIGYEIVDTNTWRSINYLFQSPGEYNVWFKVVCPNYNTFYGHDVITINYVPITYNRPSAFKEDTDGLYVDYTGLPYTFELENVVPVNALVEYSIDGIDYYTEIPSFTDIDTYVLYYKISYPNYETIVGHYVFRITEEYLESLEGFVYADSITTPYDGTSHSITVNVTKSGIDYSIYYRALGSSNEWSLTNLEFINAGAYQIEYMVVSQGYKTYKGSTTLTINKLDFEGAGVVSVATEYDGQEHGVEVTGISGFYGIKIYYTTNADAAGIDEYLLDGAWTETPITFKNVSANAYIIYVRFVCDNYNTITRSGTVYIMQNDDPEINYTNGYETEYLGRSVTLKDIGVTTIHDDNAPIIKYYTANKSGSVYTIESTTPINAPSELGDYYVTISFAETPNCAAKSIQFGFTIVRRKVYVTYDDKVEYTGYPQGPMPTIDSKTGDILNVSIFREGSDENPTDIGIYNYNFEFLTPQVNYELVKPESTNTAYPYKFEITKISLDVVINEEMDYDFDNQRYWYKDSGWEEYSCFDKLLSGHEFDAVMRTSGYSRGDYYYDSTSSQLFLNRVIVSDVTIMNAGVDVSEFYDVTIKVAVKIKYPSLVVTYGDREVVFDGNPHGLEISVPDNIRGLVYYYATEEQYEDDEWSSSKLTYINVGSYEIYFKITGSMLYEDFIGHATLTITKADLDILINEFDETYDSYPHFITHSVTNAVGIDQNYAEILYYSAQDYTSEELLSMCNDFSITNEVYLAARRNIVDAGDYKVVVIYVDNGNYNTSFRLGEVTLKQRGIRISLNRSIKYTADYLYDGEKKGLALGAATIDTSDLVYGHQIYGETQNIMIQTVSPNASVYKGSDGFEFVYNKNGLKTIVIKDQSLSDVTLNYKPIISDDELEITINKIQLTEFEAEDLEREYNGLPANPTINTPSDGVVSYIYYPIIDGVQSNIPISAIESSNVGRYYVVCNIAEGTNYMAWTGGTVGAYVTINPAKRVVNWENTTVVFNGDYQKPVAYITNVFGDRENLDVFVRYDGDIHSEGALQANIYEAIARIESNNYELTSYMEIFTIEKLTFTLPVSGKTDASDTVWVMLFDKTLFDNFPETLMIYNSSKTGQASVSTKELTPGTYSLQDEFVIDASIWYDDIDVTQSVGFIISGSVTILSNSIIFDYPEGQNINIAYDESEHYAKDYINIVVPIARNVTAIYTVNGVEQDENISPAFINVGTYEVDVRLSSYGYDAVEASYVLTISPRQSYINFTDTLNKPYDGLAVDYAAISSVISGEFNGSKDDLIYTYYIVGSNTPLSEAPYDAGEYRVVITSSADVGLNLNYTALNVEKYFEITPKSITVVWNEDYEVSNTTLGQRWHIGPTEIVNAYGLESYNHLEIELSSESTNLSRGIYRVSGYAPYDPDTSNTTTLISDGFNLIVRWTITDTNRDNIDVSKNYDVNISFLINIHYPLMVANIEDVDSPYDEAYHYGDDTNAITTPQTPTNLHKYYGTSAGNLEETTIDTFKYNLPGSYRVYYRFECDQYEPYEDYYTIVIGFDTRVVTVDHDDAINPLNKEYDGTPVGVLNGMNYYMPTYTVERGTSGKEDDYDPTLITMTYFVKGQKTPLNSVTDAGQYTYILYIPQSTYYGESYILGEFTISKKAIYIDGTYFTGYVQREVTFSDFSSASSPYTMRFSDGSQVPGTFTFMNLQVATTGSSIGTYQGSNSSLYLTKSPTIYYNGNDVSLDYQVLLYKKDLYNAKIVIDRGAIVATPISTNVPYDGLEHTIGITVISPSNGYTITYSESQNGTYTSTKPTKIAVGDYTIYIKIEAANYNTTILSASLVITQAETEINIPNMSKKYDGIAVTIPTNYTTNNPEVSRSDWDVEYAKWDENQNDYVDLALGESPINAGKYRLKIEVPASTNFAATQIIKYFEIEGIATSITWVNTSFVYDGESHRPEARVSGVGNDTITMVYTVTPFSDNRIIDNDYKSVGRYLVYATLSSENENYIFDEVQKSYVYTITPRTVTVTLTGGVPYELNTPPAFSSGTGGFVLENIVTGHITNSVLNCKYYVPGNYRSIDDFSWSTGDIIILNTNDGNADVTSNYNVEYNLALNINYSTLSYVITGYNGEYDGLYHSIDVTFNNVFADDEPRPVVTYSESLDGTYTSSKPLFKDYTNLKKVYVRIELTGYATINSAQNPDPNAFGYVNITKKNAGLKLENEYQVFDKYYDGVAVANPAMVYSNMDIDQRPLTYTYYRKQTDPTKENYGEYVVTEKAIYVGDYRLVVSLGEAENYDNGTFTRDFVIRKRTITISLPNGETQATKIFDGLLWKKSVDASMIDVKIGSGGSGIVVGEEFVGTVTTKSVNVGTYIESEDFLWESAPRIYNGINDVTSNYDIIVDIYVKIVNAQIVYTASSVETSYNASPHTISIDVTYPSTGYTITYSDESFDAAISTEKIYRTTTGLTTVYFIISAPNFDTVKDARSITVNGVTNNGVVVGPTGDIYYGDNYQTPYFNGESLGTQTVEYYSVVGGIKTLLDSKPTQAGSYAYVLHLDTDGIYAAEDFDGTYVIKPLNIDVIWNDLIQTYNGSELKPSASIDTLEESGIVLDVSDDYARSSVGNYEVSVSYNNANYTLNNPIETFKITKLEVDVPNILDDMEFRYQFDITRIENEVEVVYNFGDFIVVEDIDGNIYNLDEAGNIISITDSEGVTDASTDLPYRIVLSSNMNADSDDTKHILNLVLKDKANYCWATVSNPDEDQVVEYKINKYVFPDEDDAATITASVSAYSYEYTGEEIRPVPTVVLRKNGVIFKTLAANEYNTVYSNNTNITLNTPATITITSNDSNYEFEAIIEFMIVEQRPELFELRPGAKPIFMQVTKDEYGIHFIEDNSVERTEENKDTFFLGHVRQVTTVEKLLSQFANDTDYIAVYSMDGTPLKELHGEILDITAYAGTGCDIVLYDKDDREVDRIEVIVAGDSNGDGEVSFTDINTIYQVLSIDETTKLSYDKLKDGSYDGESPYANYTLANYYACVNVRSGSGSDDITYTLANNIYRFIGADKLDFNAEYEIV